MNPDHSIKTFVTIFRGLIATQARGIMGIKSMACSTLSGFTFKTDAIHIKNTGGVPRPFEKSK